MGRLWVFDFDDTLVKTGSRVFLTRSCGSSVALTPAQFASHERAEGDTFDFREFRELIDPRPIDRHVNLLREAASMAGSSVAIVSARSVPEPIVLFLELIGIDGIDVTALSNADPAAKALWVHRRLEAGSVDELDFFDDSLRNINAVAAIAGSWPHVTVRCHHVEG